MWLSELLGYTLSCGGSDKYLPPITWSNSIFSGPVTASDDGAGLEPPTSSMSRVMGLAYIGGAWYSGLNDACLIRTRHWRVAGYTLMEMVESVSVGGG